MTRPSRVSNSQPSVWKAGALPTALPGHVGEGTRYQDEKLENTDKNPIYFDAQ